MKGITLLCLLLLIFPPFVQQIGKDKRILFASLSNYGCDFDGDGYGDLALWHTSTNTLYFQLTSNNKFYQRKFFDQEVRYWPVFADYDGDGKTDFVFYQPDTGQWYINLTSKDGATFKTFFGNKNDLPIPTDLDGDGVFEISIWRPHPGAWVINKTEELKEAVDKEIEDTHWLHKQGGSQDTAVSADFDGDGKTDLVIWRPPAGYWFIDKSTTDYVGGKGDSVRFGSEWDVLVPNDYNNDGKDDFVYWRPDDQTWYFLYAGTKTKEQIKFGEKDEIPCSNDLDGDGIPELITWNDSKKSWSVYNLRTHEASSYKWKVPLGTVPAISVIQEFE